MTSILNKFKSVTMMRRPATAPRPFDFPEGDSLAISAVTEDGADLQLEFDPCWEPDDVADIAGILLQGGALCWQQPETVEVWKELTTEQQTWLDVWTCAPDKKVMAIKAMRTMTGAGLKEAKHAVDVLIDAIENGKELRQKAKSASLGDLINAQLDKPPSERVPSVAREWRDREVREMDGDVGT